jgi:hypothetical protein
MAFRTFGPDDSILKDICHDLLSHFEDSEYRPYNYEIVLISSENIAIIAFETPYDCELNRCRLTPVYPLIFLFC